MTAPIRHVRLSVAHAPETQHPEPERRCCSRCIRGSRAYGEMPCGYALNCNCHEVNTYA